MSPSRPPAAAGCPGPICLPVVGAASSWPGREGATTALLRCGRGSASRPRCDVCTCPARRSTSRSRPSSGGALLSSARRSSSRALRSANKPFTRRMVRVTCVARGVPRSLPSSSRRHRRPAEGPHTVEGDLHDRCVPHRSLEAAVSFRSAPLPMARPDRGRAVPDLVVAVEHLTDLQAVREAAGRARLEGRPSSSSRCCRRGRSRSTRRDTPCTPVIATHSGRPSSGGPCSTARACSRCTSRRSPGRVP